MREPGSTTAPRPGDLETWHPLARRLRALVAPAARRNAIWIIGVLLAITLALGVWALGIMDPKKMAPWESFASWAVWGSLSCALVMLAARPLQGLLARSEGYYGPHEWTGGVEADTVAPPALPPPTRAPERDSASNSATAPGPRVASEAG